MSTSAFLCVILAVTGGDTLLASCDHKQMIVRLAEIDAPEKRQDFGLRARQSLVEICLYKNAIITPRAKDRFGRITAYVNCDGTEAHSEQIKRGMAWVFEQYATDMSLYDLQKKAYSDRRGLWEQNSPAPPWEWRKSHLAPKQ